MEEILPTPAIRSYHFSFEENECPTFVEWTTETKRIAGMYGVALGLGHGRSLDIAVNIFDVDSAKSFAQAAKRHQDDTKDLYGYTSPVLLVEPTGRTSYHSFGKSPGQS